MVFYLSSRFSLSITPTSDTPLPLRREHLKPGLRQRRNPALREGHSGAVMARLLAHASVDALAQEVRVSAVAGILFDPVHHQLPDGDPVLANALA